MQGIVQLVFLALVWVASGAVSGVVAAHDPGSRAPATSSMLTQQALIALASSARSSPGFEHSHYLSTVNGVKREVVAYDSDGLRVFALVSRPGGPVPAGGWPVLLFNHGYHPSPPDYGMRNADGVSDRPGDYYRKIPQAFAERGFLVVTPDYRGHNLSQGGAFTRRILASHWYTRDSLTAFQALASLPDASQSERFMLGHSMGGSITQRALVALGTRVRAASIWSTGSDDFMASGYRRALGQASSADGTRGNSDLMGGLRMELGELSSAWAQMLLLPQLDSLKVPLQLQHARQDQSTSLQNSLAVASRLAFADRAYRLFVYASSEHLFSGSDFDQAVLRDVQWFDRFAVLPPEPEPESE